jgi:hypothetical protein
VSAPWATDHRVADCGGMAHSSEGPPGSAYPSTHTATRTHACISVACAESPGWNDFRWQSFERAARASAESSRPADGRDLLPRRDCDSRGAHRQTLSTREWAGLWVARPRYRIGERVVLFLYPLSLLGLTSPVADGRGRFLVTPAGRVRLSPAQRLWLSTEDTSLQDRIPDGIPLTNFLQRLRSLEGEQP